MVNIDFLQRAYFTFDNPVPYKVGDIELQIKPVMLTEADVFLASIDILQYDKNSSSDPEIIQMSYLEYMVRVIAEADELFVDKLSNIMYYCLDMPLWHFELNERNKPVLHDDTHGVQITAKKFDEISRIICYQNILHYDDAYVNPEFRKMMDEVDAVKNFGKEFPTLERKMNIITAHTGITKEQQKKMTFREHQGVFEEVSGEVDFLTTRALSLKYGVKDAEHWIYRNKKEKYDGYITSMGKYQKSFGGDGMIANVSQGDGTSHVEQLLQQNNL